MPLYSHGRHDGRAHARGHPEHEAWFIESLGHARDGNTIPSGHFRLGTPREAPYSKNAGFYNP